MSDRALEPPRTSALAGLGWARAVADFLRDAVMANAWVLALTGLYLAGVAIAARAWGFPDVLGLYGFWSFSAACLYVVILMGATLVALLAERPAHPLAFIKASWRSWRIRERAAAAGPLILTMPLMFSSYTSFKVAIGRVNPYRLDPLLARMDAAVHGGQAPWRLLAPWMDARTAGWLDFSYQAWFLVFTGVLVFSMVWVERPALRTRFLTAFVLCWALIGTLGGGLLASVGPCYFGRFYASDPFAAQMAALHAISVNHPLNELALQALLFKATASATPTLGMGVSSMPSMHVALAAVVACWGWGVSRTTGAALTAFTGVVLIGSVALGWHYAIDGYVAIAAVAAIWAFSGWFARPSPLAGEGGLAQQGRMRGRTGPSAP